MNTLHPNRQCRLKCKFRDTVQCVSNLVSVSNARPAISLGQHIGLRHTYGSEGVPPCVCGPLGAACWSTTSDEAVHGSA
jgi:hypothetical protein